MTYAYRMCYSFVWQENKLETLWNLCFHSKLDSLQWGLMTPVLFMENVGIKPNHPTFSRDTWYRYHYSDIITDMMASQITSLTIVYSIVYSGPDQRKYQSSASLPFVREIHRWPVNSPCKWPATRKMLSSCFLSYFPSNKRIYYAIVGSHFLQNYISPVRY